MKRSISIILSVLIVISSVVSTLMVSSAASENLWENWAETNADGVPLIFGGKASVKGSTDGEALYVDSAWYSSFWLYLPELEENTDYSMSVDYNNSFSDPPNNIALSDVKIKSVKLQTADGATNIATVETNVKLNCASEQVNEGNDRSFRLSFNSGSNKELRLFFDMGYVYRIWFKRFSLTKSATNKVTVSGGAASVNGNSVSDVVAGETVTITATPGAGQAFNNWEVVSGDINLADESASVTTFTMPNEPVEVKAVYKQNLINTLTADDLVNFTGSKWATLTSYKDGVATIGAPSYQQFYIKLPAVEKNKNYSLSFSVKNKTDKITAIYLYTDADIEKLNSDKLFVGSARLGTKIATDLVGAGDIYTAVDPLFFDSGDVTQYYIAFQYDAGTGNLYLKDLALTEVLTHGIKVEGGTADPARAEAGQSVTVKADVLLGKTFAKWEVVSGDVTVTDPTASEFTFVMPEGDVSLKAVFNQSENLWEGWEKQPIENWFTTKDNTSPPTAIIENVGGINRVTVNNAWYTAFLFKLPKVEKNMIYKLSVKYDNAKTSTAAQFHHIMLFTASQVANAPQHKSGYISNGTVIAANAPLDKGEYTEVTYELDSGSNEEYYIMFRSGDYYCFNAYFTDFSLVKTSAKIAPDHDKNLGSVTPDAVIAKEGDKCVFTAAPLKGNEFEGWYDAKGNLISKELVLEYTTPNSLESPVARFKSGSPAMEWASFEGLELGDLVYFDESDNYKKVVNNDIFDIIGVDKAGNYLRWQKMTVTNKMAHSGKNSVNLMTMYSHAGRKITGLEKNTEYAISFWTYIAEGSDQKLTANIFPNDTMPVYPNANGEMFDRPSSQAIGYSASFGPMNKWQEVTVRFNSGDCDEVMLWIYLNGPNSNVWADDFAIFKPAEVSVVAGLGGSATASENGMIVKGSEVTFTATPNAGNNFIGWEDENGKTVSTDAVYTTKINGDVSLKAVFDGYNMPGHNLFAENGNDGTFEVGTIGGWYADDPEYSSGVSWCNWTVNDKIAFRGKKSLAMSSVYRNSILPLSGLNKNTNYKFSFYVNYAPYTNMYDKVNDLPPDNRITAFGIVGEEDTHFSTAKTVYAAFRGQISAGSGWHKVEFYFNSGDATTVNFVIRYNGNAKHNPRLYFDNVSLFEYRSNGDLINPDFTDSIAPWLGNGTVSDNALALAAKGDTAYQLISVENLKKYIVTFRAKGEVFAAATDVTANTANILAALSSKSFAVTSGDSWKEYSYEFYAGVHYDVGIAFTALSAGAMVDSVTVTESASSVGAVIENIDFESERFALRPANSAYEIYKATGNNDKNVHSGNASLHFKGEFAADDLVSMLDEAFLSYGAMKNTNYRVTLYFKATSGDTIYVAPNMKATFSTIYDDYVFGNYCEDMGYEHTVSDDGWNKIQFTFTAAEDHVIKTIISDIVDVTKGDFYIDDILFAIAPDLVTVTDFDKPYCENLYNQIQNGSFEKDTATTWPGLNKNITVINDKSSADSGDKYLSFFGGERYVMPLNLDAGEVYYFAASAKGNGKIYLATHIDGETIYFVDGDENPASIIKVNDSDWHRSAFGFRAPTSGVVYLVMEADAKGMAVDTVMLYKRGFEYEEDPNRYYERVDFDFDNPDTSLAVYGGGLDDVNNDSPATGDSTAALITVFMTFIVSAALLVLFKRKEVKSK